RNRPGVDDQDHHRSLQRLHALPPRAARAAPWRADRSGSRHPRASGFRRATRLSVEPKHLLKLCDGRACPGHLRFRAAMKLEGITAAAMISPSPGGGGSVRHRAKRDKGRGGVTVSPAATVLARKHHPTPAHISLRSYEPTLPLQGTVVGYWQEPVRATSLRPILRDAPLRRAPQDEGSFAVKSKTLMVRSRAAPCVSGRCLHRLENHEARHCHGQQNTASRLERLSPHPGPYLASLDCRPPLPLKGRVSTSSVLELARQHFLKDLAADLLVGERGVVPPPAIPIHLLGRGND